MLETEWLRALSLVLYFFGQFQMWCIIVFAKKPHKMNGVDWVLITVWPIVVPFIMYFYILKGFRNAR